jgi:predicted outer membrane repeat protein
MLKRLLVLFSLTATLCGCPYTEGCEGLPKLSAEEEPADPENDVEVDDGPVQGRTLVPLGPDQGGNAAAIDFGEEPKGGPALSTLSCPELAMPKSAATVFVDVNAKGTEEGTKSAPFRSLAKAFGSATPYGVVYVAKGTYKENLTVPNKDLVVFGGFASGFGSRTNACATVIEAANASQPVINAPSDVKSFALEGVTVRKGARGLLVVGDTSFKTKATFTIARSVFTENGSRNEAGGALALDTVNARVFRSVFRDNQASKGAAIAAGGDVTLTIDQNLFEKNLGYADHGGGLYISAKSSKITRNTFRGNATGVGINNGQGGGWGGALIVYNSSESQPAKADLSFNVFTENTAGIGAAVFVDDGATVSMSHDLVYRNRAYPENGFLRGAAIEVDGTGFPGGGSTFTGDSLTVVNNIYDDKGVARTTSYGGNIFIEGYSKAKISNSIFWNNGQHGFYVQENNELTIDNSIGTIGCSSANDKGFIPANANACKLGQGVFQPEAIYFGDEDADDYHEKSTAGRFSKGTWVIDDVTSPAIDKGDPSVAASTEPAPNGNRANLGAFAGTIEASKSP